MPPAADFPIRIRFVHTRYGHWGGKSGYPRFISHLDPVRFRTETHTVADNHDDVSFWLRPMKPWLRHALGRRSMKWYKASDLDAELRAFGRCLAGRLDLVHFLDGEHGGQFLPRLLERARSKVRTVVTYHQPADLLEQIIDPAILPFFDHIVLMAPAQRAYFHGRVPDERISVILHGVDTGFFRPAEARRGSGPPRCVTAGHWLRDWRVFRHVAERMPGVEFHVVTGRDTGAEDLPNVHRHVGIDDDALAELYRSADVLFMPLLDATANNALLEGVASGLPTVTTDLPGVRAYLTGEEAMTARAGDGEAHLACLRQVLEDPARLERMGRHARLRAETLSWTRVAMRYEALYAQLAGQRTSAPEATAAVE